MRRTGESISTVRFIEQLDRCFAEKNLTAAASCLSFWEGEAKNAGDERGLLTVMNEAVGLYRRTKEREKARHAVEECLTLLKTLDLMETASGNVILVNCATTLSSLGETEKSIPLYEAAQEQARRDGRTDTYEYAALLNNKAAALDALERYDEAEAHWREAIRILKEEGKHDGEIAISYVCLAHLFYDRGPSGREEAEHLMDDAWEYLNSPRITERGGNYAFVLEKCAPSFTFFGREIEAQALRETAEEIYGAAR